MIILDTNVVSEPLKPSGSRAVHEWLDQQVADTLYLTATSLGELLVGVELLPTGKRKKALTAGLKELLDNLFDARTLAFDSAAAAHYATLVSKARTKGFKVPVADGQIAAIAQVHGFSVATRDKGPFEAMGIRVVNPWTE
jgi:toxin FitB